MYYMTRLSDRERHMHLLQNDKWKQAERDAVLYLAPNLESALAGMKIAGTKGQENVRLLTLDTGVRRLLELKANTENGWNLEQHYFFRDTPEGQVRDIVYGLRYTKAAGEGRKVKSQHKRGPGSEEVTVTVGGTHMSQHFESPKPRNDQPKI